MRPAVIIQRIGPYHRARMAALQALCGQALAVEVCALDETYAWEQQTAPEAFDRVTLFERLAQAVPGRLGPAMTQALDQWQPDLVAIPGWADPAALFALDWAHRNRVPTVIMSDSRREDVSRNPLTEVIKRLIVRSASAGLVAGESHAAYLSALGLPRDRIATGYDVVDNAHFATGADAARNDPGSRARLGLPQDYLLVLARMVPKKNLSLLVQAYARYRDKTTAAGQDPIDLVIAGDGPGKAELLSMMGQGVHLRPFASYDTVPALLGLSRGLVLPSVIEQWGLVVNEAMAAGCPVLVSNRAGAAELVTQGKTGFVAAPDLNGLSRGLELISAADSTAMGAAARTTIAQWGPDRFAKGLMQMAPKARPAGPLTVRLTRPILTAITRRNHYEEAQA